MNITIVFTFLMLIMSAIFFYITIKAKVEKTGFALISIINFLGVIVSIFGIMSGNEELPAISFGIATGLFFIEMAIQTLVRLKKCTVTVETTVTGFSFAGRRITPKITFVYENNEYTTESFINFSTRKCKKFFTVGQKYTGYINPEFPNHCTLTLKPPLYIYLLFIFALIFIVFSVLGLIY